MEVVVMASYLPIKAKNTISNVPWSLETGNVTLLKFRFDMAMNGRFGMELQPEELSEKEKLNVGKSVFLGE